MIINTQPGLVYIADFFSDTRSMSKIFEPDSVTEFRFLDCSYSDGLVSLKYGLDDMHVFEETIHFPGAPRSLPPDRQAALERVLRLLHLVTGVSYYKAAAPRAMNIQGAQPSAAELKFLQDLYVGGLSEYAYTNQIKDLPERVGFNRLTPGPTQAPVQVRLARRTAVPIGGGKDSVVALAALQKAGEPLVSFSVGLATPIKNTATQAGSTHFTVTRTMSPLIDELNHQGALNGHIPVTAIVSLIAVLAGLIYDFDTVAMSNERSANAGSFEWEGLVVNHQFSKSLEVERALQAQLHDMLGDGLTYFSLLRPLSELHIAKLLADLPQYHRVFTSCNRLFRRDASRRALTWCTECPKCRFVFLMLAPFLAPDKMVSIFGRNMLEDSAQIEGFMALIAVGTFKPFDCVGEVSESVAAFERLRQDRQWQATAVVKHYEKTRPGLKSHGDWEEAMAFSEDHALPPRFEKILRDYVAESAAART